MLKKSWVILLSALFLSLPAREGSVRNIVPCREELHDAVAWSDSVYRTLSPKERVGQLFIVGVNATDNEATRNSVVRFVETYKVGGLLFSKGSAAGQAAITNLAQNKSKVPLLITADGEWGLAMRLSDTPKFPRNMTIGAANDDSLTYAYGREVGRQSRRLGIHVNFAPDMDVNSNPANPVIGSRAFGDSPEEVARLGILYSRGLSDEGILPVAKHFPGHGDVAADSHKTLPVNNKTLQEIAGEELVPFKKYIEAGMKGIMTGHLHIPALDPADGMPTSLSPLVVDTLLKKGMGFNGLVFTDALEMKGASADKQALKALLAGNDILLKPLNIAKSIAEIEEAVADGTLSEERLEKAVKKVLRFKYTLMHERESSNVDLNGLTKDLNSAKAEELIYSLYAGAVTLLKNDSSIIPFKNIEKKRFTVMNFGSSGNSPFTAMCRNYTDINTSGDGEHIMIAAIHSGNAKYLQQVREACEGKRYVAVFFTSPYSLGRYADVIRNAEAVVLAYENETVAEECAAEVLFGGLGAKGVLPVNIPGLFARGTGIRSEATRLGYAPPEAAGMDRDSLGIIDDIVNEGLREGAYPGCQVLVARHGKIVYNKAFGTLNGEEKNPVTVHTVYDLASVTKCTATLPAIMRLCSDGKFDPENKLSVSLPELDGYPVGEITGKEALYHESGLPSGISWASLLIDTASYDTPLFSGRRKDKYRIQIAERVYANADAKLRSDLFASERCKDYTVRITDSIYALNSIKDTILAEIVKIKPKSPKKYKYSDINFLLLQRCAERVSGVPLDRYVDSLFYAPLGMTHTGFSPLSRFSRDEIAPTEDDDFMRKELLQGYTHDETACFTGGVSGNAGLFGTATDLAKLLQMFLNNGSYGGERYIGEECIRQFTHGKSPNSRRGLGFDKPDTTDVDKSPTSDRAPGSVYGHTGYTGTAFWVDPDNDLIYIFISNRVFPHRWNTKLMKMNIRPRIQSAIYSSIIKPVADNN